MQLNNLKSNNKKTKIKRIGRGGKRGTYSGKGIKGQKSRAGKKLQPIVRELIKRYPKLRGHKQKIRHKLAKSKPFIVNLEILEKKFQAGEVISPETLFNKKIITKMSGKLPQVKILNKGKITKKFIFSGVKFSESAKGKIAVLQGEVNLKVKVVKVAKKKKKK